MNGLASHIYDAASSAPEGHALRVGVETVLREAARTDALAVRRLMASADRSRGKIARAFRDAFLAGRASLDLTTVEILSGSGFEQSVDSYLERALKATHDQLLPSELPAVLLGAATRAANAVRTATKARTPVRAAKRKLDAKVLPAFDKTNQAAIDWAAAHSAELVSEVLDETRQAIRSVMRRAFALNIPPKDLARILVNVVSMTEKQGNAVVNLHQTIITSPGKVVKAGKVRIRVPKEGMDDARLNRVLQSYSERLTRQRALVIARTETIAASNQGQMMLWEQAQAQGLLPAVIVHEWIAAPSERTCPICSGLDGEKVVVGQPFSNGSTNPPAHPMCRCSTGLVH